MNWADLVIAAISAFCGGGILKIAEYWLNRAKIKSDQAKDLREENRYETSNLRAEIKSLKEEIRDAEKREDDWKMKFWEIHFKYNSFLLEVQSILLQHGISPKDVFKKEDDV